MPKYVYVRAIDDIHRSIETGFNSSTSTGPTIGPTRRDFLSVASYAGTQIDVPLRYLAATAVIEVTGDEQCSIHGASVLIVFIQNEVNVSDLTRGKMRSELTNAGKGALGKKIGDGVKGAMQDSGIERRIAGVARNAVHGEIHSNLSKVGKAVGASFKTTESISNFASRSIGGVAAAAATKGVAAGVIKLAGGVSIASALLESTPTGMGASLYDQSYSGKASDGTAVTFRIKGAAD